MVFAEAFVSGDEYTVSILQGAALPSIRILPATEFYDYQAKYFRDDTQYFCPSGLDAQEEAELQAAALAAFKVTDCFGWGRVDFMRDRASNKFYFIEINTTPGMTEPQPGADGRAPGRHRLRGAGVARAGNQFLEDAQMMMGRLMHRNRFKSKPKAEKQRLAVAGVLSRLAPVCAPRRRCC